MSGHSNEQSDAPLPETDEWQPRDKAAETQNDAFLRRCKAAEELILTRVREDQ